MTFKRVKKLICLLLAVFSLCALLSACGDGGEPDDDTQDTKTTDVPDDVETTVGDGRFTLGYTRSASFNPFVTTDVNNDFLMSLIYEGLFWVDSKYEAHKMLCSEFETENGITWYLSIPDNIIMHDGSTLTAADVVYSISYAKHTNKYSSRLSVIRGVSSLSSTTLMITLYYADYSLPSLLDTPIVKSGTAENSSPVGTGPYRLIRDTEYRLSACTSHRNFFDISLPTIYLRELKLGEVSELFTTQEIDAYRYDVTNSAVASRINVHADFENRRYDTTEMQFVGFNMDVKGLDDPQIRRAISYIIDREYIVDNLMSGGGRAAWAVYPSTVSWYDKSWEEYTRHSTRAALEIFANLGMEDSDSDGYLEYNDGGTLVDLSFKFIVNQDSPYKVSAARRIVSDLQDCGIDAQLEVLGWESYKGALAAGRFGMYYAETRLSADFDLTRLIGESGGLNFGRDTDSHYGELNAAFLAAADEDAKKEAAGELCRYLAENCHIIPVAYKRYVVMSQRGMIGGFEPTQSGIFTKITEWDIKLG